MSIENNFRDLSIFNWNHNPTGTSKFPPDFKTTYTGTCPISVLDLPKLVKHYNYGENEALATAYYIGLYGYSEEELINAKYYAVAVGNNPPKEKIALFSENFLFHYKDIKKGDPLTAKLGQALKECADLCHELFTRYTLEPKRDLTFAETLIEAHKLGEKDRTEDMEKAIHKTVILAFSIIATVVIFALTDWE
ncbi:MAG: hypothetical protein ACOYK9_05025 [Chlamydiia bacterium]